MIEKLEDDDIRAPIFGMGREVAAGPLARGKALPSTSGKSSFHPR